MVAQANSNRRTKVGESRFIDRLRFTSIQSSWQVLRSGDKVALGFSEWYVALLVDGVGSIVKASCESGAAED